MLIDILKRWNRWGNHQLAGGHVRDITKQIIPYLDQNDLITPLIGSRRAGKTTVMYQLMDYLESQAVPKEAMLHVNFEEPKLTPYLSTDGLDQIYNTYREHIHPTGKAYLFLDEIQNVPEWERWVRARNKTEDVKIVITGSSAKLMSGELATVLTGRHVSFNIMPLSFTEHCRFKGIQVPDPSYGTDNDPMMQQTVNEYLGWGGYPRIALTDDTLQKKDILVEYFNDILYKDVILRHEIRDANMLKNIAIHLLTNTGSLTSMSRMANIFGVSNDLADRYAHHIEDAYLFDLVELFTLKTSVRIRNPLKIHALDCGLRNAISVTNSDDEGHLVESLVYQQLKRKYKDNVYYWKNGSEADFVVREGNEITHVFQAASHNLNDEKVLQRELKGLDSAKQHFPNANCTLIVKDMPTQALNAHHPIISLWKFLA